ncbi:MAG: penicillin-binding protein activator [Deltaproteobacteria bacterium]|nr:penicillin-binding protein activator [Deltaproteobacteria bacterium]
MKSIHIKSIHIIILVITLSFYACVSKRIIPSIRLEPDESLFMKAEKLFEKKYYSQAIDKYQEYLERFPDKEMAPAALMKIGTIEAILGHYPESINSYARLIKEYPESIFVDDAMVASLRAYYREGKYQEVIDSADQILKKTVSKEHILNIYIILGDTYIAQKNPVVAVYYYTLAYGKADALTKESILVKLKEGVKPLRYTDIAMVLEFIDDKHLEGLVLYLMGMVKTEEEYYDDAKRILSEFIDKFPDHEKAGMASEQLKKLESLSVYEHHTIGCLLPLSGHYKVYGNRALHGIELALNKFIAQNTNQDTKKLIKIIIKDTGSTPDKAISAIEEFYQEGVAAIIGPIFSVEAAAIEAQNKGIPIITITQKDNIAETGDFVFRNFFTPQMQVKAIISFAVEKLGVDRFAILYPDEKYGKTFMNLFWDEVIASGGVVTGLESYSPDKTDFSAPIKKLVGLYYEIPEDLLKEKGNDKLIDDDNILDTDKKPKPIIDFDALFIPDGPKRAGLIMPQLAYNDIEDVYIFGTNLWHSDRLIEMAHKYVQDAVMPDVFFAGSSSEDVQDFVKRFKDSFKKEPGFIEAVAYDTAMILFSIISRSDVSFRSTVKNELTRMAGFEGITGHTRFTKNGDVEKKLYLLNIKGKKFIEIKR